MQVSQMTTFPTKFKITLKKLSITLKENNRKIKKIIGHKEKYFTYPCLIAVYKILNQHITRNQNKLTTYSGVYIRADVL